MILSTEQELRLYAPNNAVDDVTIWAGFLDESEKDFLTDKLGSELYNRLCEFYASLDKNVYYENVVDGTYKIDPWQVLLRNAQVMVVNYTLYRNYFSLVLSVNGVSINVSQTKDFGNADERLLDKSVQEYKVKAFTNLNTLLSDLEAWAKDAERGKEVVEIISLWKRSHYYFEHADLLIPTCDILMRFIDIRESREKFIRLLPDLRFIQDEYIEESFGEGLISDLLKEKEEDKKLLRKVRRLIVALLEQRTTVLTIDKVRRQQAHDESVSLKEQILSILKAREEEKEEEKPEDPNDGNKDEKGYKNNKAGSRIFVSPLLY